MDDDEIYEEEDYEDEDDSGIEDDDEDFELDDEPIYRTYKMDFEKGRIAGMIEGVEATIQYAQKALQTKRYAYPIYDDQYGCDIFNKIGNPSLTEDFFDSDIPVMIEDALSPDDSVEGIEDVDFEMEDRDSVLLSFTINTSYGDIDMEGVVYDE